MTLHGHISSLCHVLIIPLHNTGVKEKTAQKGNMTV